jgi:putative phosphonate metabolism protein
MTAFPRYAIYYAPPAGATLDDFGATLLGYSAWSGADLAFPEQVESAVPDWRNVTTDPRTYGFHATLKAPFALAPARTEDELLAAGAAFAATPRAVPVIRPVVDAISGFIAVVPMEPPDALYRLASDCVTDFDRFRAPLTKEDRARRKPESLTPRQCDYLDRWGYPYVMEEFRFHMTLTGRLGGGRREAVVPMLRERFAEIDLTRLAVDRIALFRQESATSRFKIIGHWALRGINPIGRSEGRAP